MTAGSQTVRWRYLPATWDQMAQMDALGIHHTPHMTRGEAADLIAERKEEDPEHDRHPFDLD